VPSAAVHVPRDTLALLAPAAIAPLTEPVRVRTTAPVAVFVTVTVRPCAPAEVATLPWLASVAEKVTGLPAAGLVGDHVTVGTRSELGAAVSTSGVGFVYALLLSSCSATVPPASATA